MSAEVLPVVVRGGNRRARTIFGPPATMSLALVTHPKSLRAQEQTTQQPNSYRGEIPMRDTDEKYR